MTVFRSSKVAWVCAVLLGAGWGGLSWRVAEQERTMAAVWETQYAAEADAARVHDSRLPVEVSRSVLDKSELLRLRGEVTRLRAALDRGLKEHPEVQRWEAERRHLEEEKESILQLRGRATCIENLERIYRAKQEWMARNPGIDDLPVTLQHLHEWLGENPPRCPAGGSYTPNRVSSRSSAPPSCSIHGIAIPE
jgi:hypothetical protein